MYAISAKTTMRLTRKRRAFAQRPVPIRVGPFLKRVESTAIYDSDQPLLGEGLILSYHTRRFLSIHVHAARGAAFFVPAGAGVCRPSPKTAAKHCKPPRIMLYLDNMETTRSEVFQTWKMRKK